MTLPPQQEAGTSASNKPGDCSSPSVFFFAWLMIVAVSFGRVFTGVILTLFELPELQLVPFFMAVGQTVLLVLLLAAPALRWSNPYYRSIFRSLAVAALFPGITSFIYLTKPYDAQLHAVLHIVAAAVYILVVWLLTGRTQRAESRIRSGLLVWAIVPPVLFSIPWLAWGALGSPVDTFLQLSAALSLGLACAVTLERVLFHGIHPISRDRLPYSRPSPFIIALAAGTILLLIFSGTGSGYHMMQLLLMLSLPPLGFLTVHLWRISGLEVSAAESSPTSSRSILLPLTLLIGLSAAAPMMLIDPVDVYLVAGLGRGEIIQWALSAAIISALIALALNIGYAMITLPRSVGKAQSALILTAALLAGGLVYFGLGQPGFHSNTLFVILTIQADVSQAYQIEDLNGRKEFVYTHLVKHADQTQMQLRSQLDRYRIRYKPFYLVNAVEVNGGPLLRLWLSAQPEVDRVLPNPWMRPLPSGLPLSTGDIQLSQAEAWNLAQIRAPEAWEAFGVTGEGIVIGQSDSGAEWTHPELLETYRGADGNHDYNWLDPWYGSRQPVDFSGHGTHTLGSAVGKNTGAAPGATWFGCANLVRNLGNPTVYLECMQFMLAPYPLDGSSFTNGDPSRGAHIINNSWSCPEVEGCDAASLLPAVRALRAAGIFIIVSAGNDGPACESLNKPPALYKEVFSVGAVDRGGRLAFFSSIGPVTADGSQRTKPDLVAPGVEVFSSMPGSTYARQSGTSMAGPHAAGVAALMWSANPALIGDIDRTEQILTDSAQRYSYELPDCPGAGSNPSTAVGFGLLDAYEAVRIAVEEADK
jgi:subtilisin family serine protease